VRDVGVYIHFPFCRARCPYCDFKVDVVRDIPQVAYADAVIGELISREASLRDRRLRSVYLGGGTPSLWRPDQLARVLSEIRTRATEVAADVEITAEVNPSSASKESMAGLLEAGVNRLSIGVQSFDDDVLQFLGRWHSATEARATLEASLEVGFSSVSFDLIAGIPDRSLADWVAELQAAEAYPEARHLSVYELTFHRGTPLWRHLQQGRFGEIHESLAIAILEETSARMSEQGRPRYEVSNYAAPGS